MTNIDAYLTIFTGMDHVFMLPYHMGMFAFMAAVMGMSLAPVFQLMDMLANTETYVVNHYDGYTPAMEAADDAAYAMEDEESIARLHDVLGNGWEENYVRTYNNTLGKAEAKTMTKSIMEQVASLAASDMADELMAVPEPGIRGPSECLSEEQMHNLVVESMQQDLDDLALEDDVTEEDGADDELFDRMFPPVMTLNTYMHAS